MRRRAQANWAAGRLESAGVARDRIEFVGKQSWRWVCADFGRIDIALDPFPYGGGITTCDGIWMGVPIVTLTGRTAVGRRGDEQLNIGLKELIATDAAQYVRIAADLAADLPKLAELRKSLRQRMRESPLMDAAGFARDVEKVFGELA